MSIVVAYTPDAAGEAALDAGMQEAWDRSVGIVVVNATKGDAYVDPRYSQGLSWEQVEERLAESGLQHEVRRPMGADIADLILDVASEVEAELIVVGLRRRTPIGKLIMGSTAQRVLLDAVCPVLAVKPDAPEEPHGA